MSHFDGESKSLPAATIPYRDDVAIRWAADNENRAIDMTLKKILTLLSDEWLPRRGDYDELLVQFSITDARLRVKPDKQDAVRPQKVIVKISGSQNKFWIRKYAKYDERQNLEKGLLDYARCIIREKIKSNTSLGLGEELHYDVSSDYLPVNPAEIQVQFGQPEEITIERKIGFLP